MLIRPAEHLYRALPWVPQHEWREPSQAEPKNHLGHPARLVRQVLTARLADGHIRWRGVFDSREDADAFLYALVRCIALGEPMPPVLWRLPTPHWHPDVSEGATYEFLTFRALTGYSSSNQTDTVPVDFSATNNLYLVSAGSNAANSQNNTRGGGGGGGGGFATAAGVALTPGGTATYRLRDTNAGTGTSTACWYNGTALSGSSLGIQCAAVASGATGGAGAVTTSATGDTKTAGGTGANGATNNPYYGGGGGGAAGPNGVGGGGSIAPGAGGTGDGGAVAGDASGTNWTITVGGAQVGPGGGGHGGGGAVLAIEGGYYGAGGGGPPGAGSQSGKVGRGSLFVMAYLPRGGRLIDGGALVGGKLVGGSILS